MMRHFILGILITALICTGAPAGDGDALDLKDAPERVANHPGATVRPRSTPALPKVPTPVPAARTPSQNRTRPAALPSIMDLWTKPIAIFERKPFRGEDTVAATRAGPRSTVFSGPRDVRPLRFGWSSPRSAEDGQVAEDDGSWSLMLESLKAVAPTAEDRRILKSCLADYPRLESFSRLEVAHELDSRGRPESTGRLLQPYRSLEEGLPFESELPRPFHEIERLAQKFAEELVEAHEKVFAPIWPEARLYSIHTRGDYPTDAHACREAQEFLDGYLRRRAPRAVTRALFTTARDLPIVEDCYRELMAIRNKYFNLTFSYGGYGKDRIRDAAKESVEELTDRNVSSQDRPDETIDEELARRRLRPKEKSFNPFRKGRVSLSAAPLDFGDWIVLVWKTPNLKVRAGIKKMRVQFGGRLGGLDFSSYATTRFKGLRGRSGVEVVRQLGTSTRLRLSAGVNFGRQEDHNTDLVDITSITGDRSYLLFSWEREF